MIYESPRAGPQAQLIGTVAGLKRVLASGGFRLVYRAGFGTEPNLLVEVLLYVEAELYVLAIYL